jgi:hypothetical protein
MYTGVFRVANEFLEVVEPRCGCELSHALIGFTQHAYDPTYVTKGAPTSCLDDAEPFSDFVGLRIDDHACRAGANRDEAHRVGHDVMKLSCNADALFARRLADALFTFPFSFGGALCDAFGIRTARAGVLTREPPGEYHSWNRDDASPLWSTGRHERADQGDGSNGADRHHREPMGRCGCGGVDDQSNDNDDRAANAEGQ